MSAHHCEVYHDHGWCSGDTCVIVKEDVLSLLVDEFLHLESCLECRSAVLIFINIGNRRIDAVVESMFLEPTLFSLYINSSVHGLNIKQTVAACVFDLDSILFRSRVRTKSDAVLFHSDDSKVQLEVTISFVNVSINNEDGFGSCEQIGLSSTKLTLVIRRVFN